MAKRARAGPGEPVARRRDAVLRRSGAMTVLLKDMAGATLWQRSFEPERA